MKTIGVQINWITRKSGKLWEVYTRQVDENYNPVNSTMVTKSSKKLTQILNDLAKSGTVIRHHWVKPLT